MDHKFNFDAAGEASRILTQSIAAQLNKAAPPHLLRARQHDAACLTYGRFAACMPLADDQVTSLVKGGHFHPAHERRLKADLIERLIRRRCRLDKRAFRTIANVLKLLPVRALAKEAALIASEARACIALALQGRLRSAVAAVPRVSITAGEGYDPEQILEVIEEIAGYHIMVCVVAEAQLAKAALFAPTGVRVLDDHGGSRSVPLAFTGRTILWNAGEIIKVLDMRDIGRELNEAELATITQFDGLVDHARQCEASWQVIYGDHLPMLVDNMHAQARRWSRYVRRHVGQVVKESGRNASLHAFQRSEPLATFWLACDMAMGWLSFPNTGKRTLRTGVPRNRLTDAIKAMRVGDPIKPPTYGDANLFDARCLFYLMRVLVVGDCYSSGRKGSPRPITPREAQARIERAVDASPSDDPLRTGYEDLGGRRYGKGARSAGTAAELLPSMWVKLHS